MIRCVLVLTSGVFEVEVFGLKYVVVWVAAVVLWMLTVVKMAEKSCLRWNTLGGVDWVVLVGCGFSQCQETLN